MCRFLANKFLVVQTPHGVEQRVEWLYAFDIHCNRFVGHRCLRRSRLKTHVLLQCIASRVTPRIWIGGQKLLSTLLDALCDSVLLTVCAHDELIHLDAIRKYAVCLCFVLLLLHYVPGLRRYATLTLVALLSFRCCPCHLLVYTYVCLLRRSIGAALPFLENTTYFLYPIMLVLVLFVVTLPFNFNMCTFVMRAYFH